MRHSGGLATGRRRRHRGAQFHEPCGAGYEVIAKIDTGDALTETNELNNEVDTGIESFWVRADDESDADDQQRAEVSDGDDCL